MNRVAALVKELLRDEPVITAWALNGGLAALLGFVFHLSPTREAAVTTIVTALVTAYTAMRTRPARVTTATGALGTVITAAASFGLHLSGKDTGLMVAALAAVMILMQRMQVSPVK